MFLDIQASSHVRHNPAFGLPGETLTMRCIKFTNTLTARWGGGGAKEAQGSRAIVASSWKRPVPIEDEGQK